MYPNKNVLSKSRSIRDVIRTILAERGKRTYNIQWHLKNIKHNYFKEFDPYLDLFEWNFKGEGLIIVRIQRAFLDCRLLFLDAFTVKHERDLDVRIYTRDGGAQGKIEKIKR